MRLMFLLLVFTQPAYAYVGPGLGAGAIAAVIGIVGAVFLALFAILFYPIKRALKKRKANKKDEQSANTEETDE